MRTRTARHTRNLSPVLILLLASCGTTGGEGLSPDGGLGGDPGDDSGGSTNVSSGTGGAGGVANGGNGGASGGTRGRGGARSGTSSGGVDAGTTPSVLGGECETEADCSVLETYPEGCAEAQCDDGECSYVARDADGDGFRAERCRSQEAGIAVETEADCDDEDDLVNPNGWDGPRGDDFDEGCNDGVDQDCSGTIDDGQLSSGATCVCAPGGTEACATGPTGIPIDYPVLDDDGEPVGECELGSRECLPNGTWGPCTDAVAPIDEFCNGLDDDCDGDEDDGALDFSHYFCDEDSDEHLAPTASGTESCQPPEVGCEDGTWRENPAQLLFDDCDDEDPNRTPGRDEVCDSLDNDCNGTPDDDATDELIWSYDADGDQYRDQVHPTYTQCDPPDTAPAGCTGTCPNDAWVGQANPLGINDCDEANPGINPTAQDLCDGTDYDCDGGPDTGCDCSNADPTACGTHPEDGTGPCQAGERSCNGGQWTQCTGSVGPSAEQCGSGDLDCDDVLGNVDPDATNPLTWYCDADIDGHLPESPTAEVRCTSPSSACAGAWTSATLPRNDCDDGDPQRYQGLTETCDDKDNDCDDLIDDNAFNQENGLKTAFYCDADSDGLLVDGAPAVLGCSPPITGCVGAWRPNPALQTFGDCDDGDSAVFPGATEVCDNKDNDCNDLVDDDGANENVLKNTYVCDADQDGHLSSGATLFEQCSAPPAQNCTGVWRINPSQSLFDDCNDADDEIHGALDEVCDGKDNDCVGGTDVDAIDESDWYIDNDEDDYGDEDATPISACSQPPDPIGTGTYVEDDATDCDDDDPTSFPNAAERCDGEDNDCSGTADDNNAEDACSLTSNVMSAMCEASACAVDICLGTFADCSGGYANGCETDTSDDVDHCGDCDTSCSLACVGSGCDEVAEVGGGALHTCARTTGGRALCWGGNLLGQLGDTTETQRNTPTEVAVLDAVQQIDAGRDHNCAINLDSPGVTEAYCWGFNFSGQLGTTAVGSGSGSFSDQPVQVEELVNPSAVSAGEQHSCAIDQARNVRCWGANAYGQLGDGVTNGLPRTTPSTVSKGTQAAGEGLYLQFAIDLSVGSVHSCAIVGQDADDTSGQVMCWGRNTLGQLGDGVTHAETCGNCALTPVVVSTITDAVALSTGSDAEHTCALRATGAVMCWGNNGRGQLGNNSTTNAVTPVTASGITAATALAAGEFHTCAIDGGIVKCWGYNAAGQLGDGVTHSNPPCGNCALVPQSLTSFGAASSIGAAAAHTCAVRASDDQTHCWGAPESGRLGNGTVDPHLTPFPISPEL